MGVSTSFSCNHSETKIGSSSPTASSAVARALAAENAVNWKAPPGSRPFSRKASTMALLSGSWVKSEGSVTNMPSTASPAMALISGLRSEEHTSELQSRGHLVCRLLLEKKKYKFHLLALLLIRPKLSEALYPIPELTCQVRRVWPLALRSTWCGSLYCHGCVITLSASSI